MQIDREIVEQALEALDNLYLPGELKRVNAAINALRAALAQPEDKSQAAFEHWVETVEATQGCAISRNAVADSGSIIKPEIKGDNPEPPPEAQTEAEKIAYCAGWWAAMQKMREQEPVAWIDNSEHPKHRLYRQSATEKRLYGPLRPLYAAPPRQWNGLTDEERNYFKACGFVGVGRVEEVLRAKNSIPSTKRTVTYVCPVCAASLERQE
jgi:hypothetical protein